jgi:hypothetical protein
MIYDLKNEYQIPKFKEYVNKLFKERAVVEVKKKLPNRTLAQNSYLHLLLGYFGSEYGCKQKLIFIRGLATVICLNVRRSTRKAMK